jgi:hypothetical protein
MGREVRMVPPNWEHPKRWNEHRREECYKPLYSRSYKEAFQEWRDEDQPDWLENYDKWQEGLYRILKGPWEPIPWDDWAKEERFKDIRTYEDYAGVCPASPDPSDYMPDWPVAERTHFMMYEDTSEGTPISPAFPTAEALARWLADTNASAFGGDGATYEEWLGMIHRGSSIGGFMMIGGQFKTGVSAAAETQN